MKDDYLWDGSGEPDPDIEFLEDQLKQLRYRPRTFAVSSRPARISFNWAAAAAIAIGVISAATWMAWRHHASGAGQNSTYMAQAAGAQAAGAQAPGESGPRTSGPSEKTQTQDSQTPHNVPGTAVDNSGAIKHSHHGVEKATAWKGSGSEFIPRATALSRPEVVNTRLLDPQTERHIERAQTLLVSFKNSEPDDLQASGDIVEERDRCRAILANNVSLRRTAELKGNIPMQQLLGSLEPFLLDISHLPDKPSVEDVRAIQSRIKKDDILVALQSYSSPVLARAF